MENEINNINAVDGGIFNCRYDEYFTLINADDNLFQFLGYTREEFARLFHNRVLDAIYEGDREIILAEVERQLSTSRVFRYENRLVVKGGRTRWVWVSAELVEDETEGEMVHCIFHDISRDKKSQEQLAISEKRYDIILSHIRDIIFELDCITGSIYYSPNFKKRFGYEIPSHGFPDSMFATDIIYEEDKPVLRERFQAILKGQDEMECEYRIKSNDGSYLWVDVHASAMRDEDNRLLKILGIISDIDQRKREIIKVQKEAVSDPLTGLLNRRECVAQVEAYMKRCHDPAAFMLIDVDNFKKVNDTYGHLYGDSVLNELAVSLRTAFRKEDIIARLGGDEFVVFMTNIDTGRALEDKVKRIESVFRNFTVAGGEEKVGCSIGISFYPGHGSDFRSLFAKADAAMYHVKQKGKGWFCIYGEDMEKTDPSGLTPPSRIMKKSFHDHIIEHVFRIFLEHPETGAAIAILMDMIGRVFHADRMLIFERDEGGRLVSTYQWQSEHVSGGSESSDAVRTDIRGLPLENELTVYLNTDQIENQELRRWFSDHGAKAAVTCCMKEEDEFSTVIIYEDCHGTRIGSGEEQYTLMMVSQIIHLFLEKQTRRPSESR
ncbi:sensor domain-containing diguanylate cyclase [Clostridium transplantifaecale]|uniref:sensor domain-containing diguanylate cyclase n=1 Tax=Clostridium transplantifaecale TaxID=2479838 RepID=UPI000F6336FA|nr:sensor domain-containing diguanylate cyclase [Clostridium transplantifaecale]